MLALRSTTAYSAFAKCGFPRTHRKSFGMHFVFSTLRRTCFGCLRPNVQKFYGVGFECVYRSSTHFIFKLFLPPSTRRFVPHVPDVAMGSSNRVRFADARKKTVTLTPVRRPGASCKLPRRDAGTKNAKYLSKLSPSMDFLKHSQI